MTSQTGFLLLMLGQLAVLAAVVVALCDLARSVLRLDGVLAFCAAVLMLGMLGYLCFWMAYANYAVFGVVKIAALALLLLRFALVVRGGRLAAELSWLAEPLLFTTLFTIAVLTLGFANGGLADALTTAQHRFSHSLPSDNTIPFVFAVALNADHVVSPMLADWLSSDRPPLQTGLYLLLNVRNYPLAYQVIASSLQATFLFGVWALGVAAGLPTAVRRLTLLACCLLPVTILNTFYTWPKIISVGYLLLVFTLLFVYRPVDRREHGIVGVLLGGLAALALLCHGSSAFALIGMAIMVLLTWRWPSWRTIACGIATLLLAYVPWVAYQAFADPPGNRLLKWHLAGVTEVDRRGFLETLRASYGALSWHDYVQGRLENAAMLIGRWPEHLRGLVRIVFNHDSDLAQSLRADDFFLFMSSLHGFSLALIAALVLLPFMRGDAPQRRLALQLLGAVIVNAIVCCILLFQPGSAVNHVTTYAMHVMATVAIFIVLGLRAPMLGVLFVALQAVTVVTLYAFTLPHDPAFWPTLVLCVAATIGLFVFALMPFAARRPTDAATAAR